MRALLSALVLSACFLPFTAHADVIPISPDEGACLNIATGGECTQPSGEKGTCQNATCTVSAGSKYAGSTHACVVCLAKGNSDGGSNPTSSDSGSNPTPSGGGSNPTTPNGGSGCSSARTSREGLALAFAGSLSLLFVLGKRRWNRR